MILKGVFLIVSVNIVSLLAGDLFLRLLGWERSLKASYIWGLVLIFALFQLVAYPMLRLGTSFSLLFRTFTGVVLGLTFLSLITGIAGRKSENILKMYSSGVKEFFQNAKKNVFLVLVLAGAVAVHFFMSEGFYYSSSDDGLYLTKGIEAIAQNSLAINDDMAWFGRDNAPILNFENGSTYSFFLAFLSKAFNVPISAVAKTFFLLNLLAAHLCAVSWAFEQVIEKKEHFFEKKIFFLSAYIVFQLFCVKEGSSGTWMTGFLYEGKSILIGIIFPLLLGSCFILLKRLDCFQSREWLSIAVIFLAGVSVSVIGIIFPAILYFCFGIAIVLGTRFKNFKRIWLPALLSAVPVVVFALLSFFTAKSLFFCLGGISAGDWVSSGRTVTENAGNAGLAAAVSQFLSWKDHFLYAVDLWQFVLYVLSVLYILFVGTKNQKVLFVISPLALLFTFANPLFCDFVASRITTPIVYWRIFWLFPVYFLPAFVLTDLIEKLTDGKLQRAVIIIAIAAVTYCGFEIFRYPQNGAVNSVYSLAADVGKLINVRPELRHNVYGLNAATIRTADTVLEDWEGEERPRLLFCCNRPFEIRQYSSEIVLVSEVRNYSSVEGNVPGTDVKLADFIQNYSSISDGQTLRDLLDALDVDYVYFDGESAVKDPEKFGLRFIGEKGNLPIWRVER